MTHEEAFLQSIVENPDDDTPRLIFADWLEENGQGERAEFVRVQCELAKPCRLGYSDRFHVDDACASCDPLWNRERVLSASCREWANLPALGSPWFIDYHGPKIRGQPPRALFVRGFVEQIAISTVNFLAHGRSLVRAAPLRQVRLVDREPMYGGYTYGWFETDQGDSCDVPEFWGLLSQPVDSDTISWKNYETPELARADLSLACLLWAHEQAKRSHRAESGCAG